MEKYGVEYQISSEQTRKKTKETLFDKYGVFHNMHVEDFSCKQGETKRLKKYTPDQLELINNPELLYKEYIDDKLPLYQIAVKHSLGVRFLGRLFKENGFEITTSRGYSFEQESFNSIIKETFGVNSISNTRQVISPKEIDIWLPEYIVGIEYHGLYWHSDSNDYRCFEKYKMATEKGIKLLQFFDFEIENKFDIVLNVIRSKIGFNANKINARDCFVEEITKKDHKTFCETFHLQGGDVNPSLSLGLFKKDKLVSIMSFGKSRFNKKCEWELLRYATIHNTTIRGGASKMLAYFERNMKPTSICSYADCRFSNGELYKKLGFDFKKHTGLNYFYVNDESTIVKRYEVQKHKLKKIIR